MSDTFKALMIEDTDDGPRAVFKDLTKSDLPDLDVLVEIEFSTLNYKDGLAVSGKQKIARRAPLIGGIDLAGTVVESNSPDWKPGDRVLVNGWGLSETQWGGYSKFERLKPEWLTAIPDAFTAQQAMAIGTAGYTASLCVEALENWGSLGTNDLPVLVTGAAGGVGSVAVALLTALGYSVTASTGRADAYDYLRKLGASAFVSREEAEEKGGPLQKELWSGVVDAVGGPILVNALAQTVYGGAAAACGLAASPAMPGATVLPHILRAVTLIGVDSVMAPQDKRKTAWERLARDLKPELLAEMTTVEPMSALPDLATKILDGQIRGRVVIDVSR